MPSADSVLADTCAIDAQLRPHARHQLGHRERLDEVVHRPGFEPLHAILHLAARRQHDHGQRSASLCAPTPGSPGRCARAASDRARSRRSSPFSASRSPSSPSSAASYREALRLEASTDEVDDPRLVLDQQDGGRLRPRSPIRRRGRIRLRGLRALRVGVSRVSHGSSIGIAGAVAFPAIRFDELSHPGVSRSLVNMNTLLRWQSTDTQPAPM